jgi:hypothetical protein
VALGTFVKPVLITGVLGYLAGSLLWPYALQNPFTNPLNALSEMSNFKVNIRQLFEGAKIFSGELPVSFLPKSFIITNSLAILSGLGLMRWAYFYVELSEKKKMLLYSILYFLQPSFPLAYIIYSKSNVYHAWRHVLFIFPSV